jgi:hypothetical protein
VIARLILGAAVLSLGVGTAVGAERAAADPARVEGGGFADLALVRNSVLGTALPTARARAEATWCGTPSALDSTPNAVAGYPVRFIYAIPSDGQDRFGTYASAIQTDWEAIDSWWRGQDPTRVPRADIARFSCGLQLDLSSIRLQRSGSQIAARETPFEYVFDALDSLGFNSQRTKYVVYYDGPVGDDNICGVGGALPSGLGLAVVSVQACAGANSSEIAAHELLHTMGAVPRQAPNDCPAPNDGHVCDSDRDLMYPVTDGTPLAGLTLDVGRDDYYGHAGSWLDTQDSPWLVQLDRQSPLALTISGTGQVQADIPGLLCTQSCSTSWNAGTRLTLTAAAGANAKLVRWSAPCSGSGECVVTVGEAGSVSALFAPRTYRLSVRVAGKGAVRGASGRIACPGRCVSPVSSHTSLRLRAAPAKGWKLRTWTGACRGKQAICTLPMTGNSSARAVFVRV